MQARPVEKRLKVYSGVFVAHESPEKLERLEKGDKVLMPPDLLETICNVNRNAQLPHPTVFLVRVQETGFKSHCGVLEYTAPAGCCIMPRWMMRNLDLKDGADVVVRLCVSLPKLRFAKFKSVPTDEGSSQFAAQTRNPKAALQHIFQKFTCLTVGDRIEVRTSNGRRFGLEVCEVKTTMSVEAGTIVDTDLEVEFEDESPESEHSEEDAVHVLEMSEVAEMDLAPDASRFFRVKRAHPDGMDLKVTVSRTSNSGDPDLYASVQHMRPSIADNRHEFRACLAAPQDELIVSCRDTQQAWVYVAVHAFPRAGSVSCRIVAQEVAPQEEVETRDESSGNDNSLAADDTGPPQPGQVQCDTCGRNIAAAAMRMHSLHCARRQQRVRRCQTCGKTVAAKVFDQGQHVHCGHAECDLLFEGEHAQGELEKHTCLHHGDYVIPCACGQLVPPFELTQHQQHCPVAPMECQFCKVHIPRSDFAQHEEYCGSTTTQCPVCNKATPRKYLDNHLAAFHGIDPTMPDENKEIAVAMARSDSNPAVNPRSAATFSAAPTVARTHVPTSNPNDDVEDQLIAQAIAASLADASSGNSSNRAAPPQAEREEKSPEQDGAVPMEQSPASSSEEQPVDLSKFAVADTDWGDIDGDWGGQGGDDNEWW
ncbi:MAG: hypothetical protein MHM6MM_002132 [Cercozoa sp. M6MM]